MKVTKFPRESTPYCIQLPARFFADRKRKTEYFVNREAADKRLKELKDFGYTKPEAPAIVTERHRVLLEHILSTLPGEDSEAHLYKAVEHYRKTVLDVKPATLMEAIHLYLEYREKDEAGRRSLQTVRSGLVHKLARHFKPADQVALLELNVVKYREFFDTFKKGGNRRTTYKTVNAFLNWTVERGYLAANPLDGINVKREIGDYGVNNDHFEIKDFGRMLRIAAGLEPIKPGQAVTHEFIDLLPTLVFGGFAGIRTCELVQRHATSEVVRWDDLHFDADKPNVTIRDEVAKKTKAADRKRHIDLAPAIEAIQAWLPYLPKSGPLIVTLGERQLGKLRKAFVAATGIKLHENGLRNSFCTFGTVYNGETGIESIARQMGNDAKTARRYYNRNLPTGTGKAWFDLRPFEVVVQPKVAAQA